MAEKPTTKQRGHHPTYATINGQRIDGLHQNAFDKRYYVRIDGSKKWFGSDPQQALVRFREWESNRNPQATIDFATKKPETVLHNWSGKLKKVSYPYSQYLKAIPEAEFWAMVRKLILADPIYASQMTGLPLDRLHKFKAPSETLSLAKIAALYWDKPDPITDKTKRDMQAYWDEFCKLVGGETRQLGHITVDLISEYHDKIYHDAKGKSSAYVKARFVSVKTVFRYALKRGKDVDAVKQVLTYCEMLVPPKSNGCNPSPISRKDFEACLNAADTKWTAILLLALNMAGYPVDVAVLKKEDVDLEAGTLINRRTKTRVPRIAILWARTITAIRDYQKAEPHDSDYLFLSRENGKYHPNHIGRNFRRIRANAKRQDGTAVPATVEFAHIRDGAQTAAIQGGADPVHTDFLLGHKTGIRDDYLLRRPDMVADACAAVERYYFPSDEPKGKGKHKHTGK